MNSNNLSYVYFLLDPRQHPMSPFYVGIGHRENVLASNDENRYPRPYRGHYLLKDIDSIKSLNKNNSFKLNRIISIKEQKLEIPVYIVHNNLTIQQAKEFEIYYIKRFGRKGIDKNGTLTNVMPGGDGHDPLSYDFCIKSHEHSNEWFNSWMSDENKVNIWKKHLSESSLRNEQLTHRRSINMKKVSTIVWQNPDFVKNKSISISNKNYLNWQNSQYREEMTKILTDSANKPEKKLQSSRIMKTMVKHLWETSEDFKNKVSIGMHKKALQNNSDKTIIEHQQLCRLVTMYFNKHKEYPWQSEVFDKQHNLSLLPKLLNQYLNDKSWLINKLIKYDSDINMIENFLRKEGMIQ